MHASDTLRAEACGPVCYAHRGARAHAPENTLAAFALAFDLGADAIECDARRSRDGALVVMHDATLDRTTNGRGPVAAHTLAELRALDAGARWDWPQRIPTLDEALALVTARGRALNIEMKAETTEEAIAIAEALADVLATLDARVRGRVLVSCFALPAVARAKQRLPWLRVAALFGGRQWRRADLVASVRALGAEAIHPGAALATPALLAAAHAAGLRVSVWTANRPATIRRLLALGADGLFSDFPERVIIARAHAAVYASPPGSSTT